MSRSFLLSLIVIAGALLTWLVVEEKQRSKALVAQTNEIVQLPEPYVTPPVTTAKTTASNSATPETSETTATTSTLTEPDTADAITTDAITTDNRLSSSGVENPDTAPNTSSATVEDETSAPRSSPTSQSSPTSSNSDVQEEAPLSAVAVNEALDTSVTETTPTATATTEVAACSSFDEAGLLSAFDVALAAFIADASTVYGNQYENLQYQLSSRSGVIEGEQGVVSTNYSGTVQELSTGQDVSANGIIQATFAWDGCTWQVLDYSF